MVDIDCVIDGITFNLNNIWEYMDKDYWDTDDLKFDFWYRLQRHNRIFYEVMKLNGKTFNDNIIYVDNTQELLDKLNKENKDYNVEIIWED